MTRHLIDLVESNIEVKFGMEFFAPRLIVRESCRARDGSGDQGVGSTVEDNSQ
ncbi:hypothetical protein OHD62_04815 [Mesorhizobium sp. YC-39]|uniref:hypothetical protein n=1 Tax=unclassified Mesorhizobium TaxID=325217 RepID=UPI0021E7A92B|nr:MULTISPECIES: hypothetical protein [unclassified Mesorhizobium]MCV3205912.1 hypothetical protein [Mesorhizobium sp. YC-2]MCV3227689.1 hypothetical protein [Mesorhizobium sp. YC-39]